jgi:hypothetical protein
VTQLELDQLGFGEMEEEVFADLISVEIRVRDRLLEHASPFFSRHNTLSASCSHTFNPSASRSLASEAW